MNSISKNMNNHVSAIKKVVGMFVCCVNFINNAIKYNNIAIPLYKIEYTKP